MLVLMVVLGAAVLHAAWNAMAHGVPDRLAGFALLGLSSGVVGLIAVVITGPPPAGTWPYIAASIVLHCVYYGGCWRRTARPVQPDVSTGPRYVALGGGCGVDRRPPPKPGRRGVGRRYC